MTNTIIDRLSAEQLSHLETASHGEISLLADLWNINPDSLRGALSRYRSRKQQGFQPQSEAVTERFVTHSATPYQQETFKFDVPENVVPDREPPLNLAHWTQFMYACDFHAPSHNRTYVRHLVTVAQHLGYTRLVIGGDLFDMSSLGRSHPQDLPTVSFEKTLQVGGELLAYLLNSFEEVAIVPGNHDLRAARAMGEAISFSRLCHAALNGAKTSGRLITSDYDYLYVGENWVAGHPRSYCSAPSKDLAQIATRTRKNVLGAHTHLCGMSVSPCGEFLAVQPGHMTAPKMTMYLSQSAGLSKYGEWVSAFASVDGYTAHLWSDRTTHWDRYDEPLARVIDFGSERARRTA